MRTTATTSASLLTLRSKLPHSGAQAGTGRDDLPVGSPHGGMVVAQDVSGDACDPAGGGVQNADGVEPRVDWSDRNQQAALGVGGAGREKSTVAAEQGV